MMNFILNCSDPVSAMSSICDIFDTGESDLRSLLLSIRPYEDISQPTNTHIYSKVCSALGNPSPALDVVWFHGTRVPNGDTFLKDGILTKSMARNRLGHLLTPLTTGLKKKGDNPFHFSLVGKQTKDDEGPFAFLFRDVAIHAPGNNHSYINAPEMIEDMAGELLGENYHVLIERYQSVTRPYVVAFMAPAIGHEIRHALWYLHSIVDGDPAIDAASRANTCFNSKGEVIAPHRIVRVDLVKSFVASTNKSSQYEL